MNEHMTVLPVERGFRAISDFWDVIRDGKGYVGGSYAAFMAAPITNPIQPNDIDIFATSRENVDRIVMGMTKRGYRIGIMNEVAVSLEYEGRIPVQVVRPAPFWSNFPDDILENFDFDICRAALLSQISVRCDLNAGQRTGKVLRINNPLRTLRRIVKYQARGVEFSDWEVLKVFQAWEQTSAERKAEMLELAAPQQYEDIDTSGWEYDDSSYFEGE